MVFKNVLINSGSGYDAKSGIFTTPAAGTYAFFFFIHVPENERLSTFLMLNGKQASKTYAGRIQDVNTGDNMVIRQLQKGDQVWVQTHPKNINWINWSGEVIMKYSGNNFLVFWYSKIGIFQTIWWAMFYYYRYLLYVITSFTISNRRSLKQRSYSVKSVYHIYFIFCEIVWLLI